MTSLARCPSHGLWRRSATVVLIATGNNNKPRVLTVKRSSKAKFMPNNIVFPGGLCEPADFSLKWLSIDPTLSKFGADPSAAFPDIFINDSEDPLPELSAHAGFRIAALRELYEETGVILHKNADETIGVRRSDVEESAENFIKLHKELGIKPAVAELYNWSTWLTPLGLKVKGADGSARRYDTQFYIAFIDDADSVDLQPDDREVSDVKFQEPMSILTEAFQGSVKIAPPQIYELLRLLSFDTIQELKEYAKLRDQLGTERIYPVIIKCKDGAMSILPGDSLYPDVPDLAGKCPRLSVDMTISECMKLYPRHHRVVLKHFSPPKITANFELPLRQRAPKQIITSNI